MLLEKQFSILEWYLKVRVILQTGLYMLKIQLFHPQNKLYIYNGFFLYTVISHCNNISQYSFYCILATYRLCEHETSLNNTENTSPNFWTVVVILSIDFNMNYNILDMLPHFYSQISLHSTAVSAFMFCIIQTNDNIYSSTATFPLRDCPAY